MFFVFVISLFSLKLSAQNTPVQPKFKTVMVNIPKNLKPHAKHEISKLPTGNSALMIDSLTSIIDKYESTELASNNELAKKDSVINLLKMEISRQQHTADDFQAKSANYKNENIKLEQTNRILILFNSLSAVLLILALLWVLKSPNNKKSAPAGDYILVKRTEFTEVNSVNEPNADMEQKIERLERLGNLKESGILTDEEFARQKQEIL